MPDTTKGSALCVALIHFPQCRQRVALSYTCIKMGNIIDDYGNCPLNQYLETIFYGIMLKYYRTFGKYSSIFNSKAISTVI